MPEMAMHGIFKMTFFEHVTIFSGVGVGGGSLLTPTPSLSPDVLLQHGLLGRPPRLAVQLAPHYATARRMLGAAPNPRLQPGDEILRDIARSRDKEKDFAPTHVAVFFGEPGKRVRAPYFEGKGPERTGCTFCACMTGCRVGAPRTPSIEVTSISRSDSASPSSRRPRRRPAGPEGAIRWRKTGLGRNKTPQAFTADCVRSRRRPGTVDFCS